MKPVSFVIGPVLGGQETVRWLCGIANPTDVGKPIIRPCFAGIIQMNDVNCVMAGTLHLVTGAN